MTTQRIFASITFISVLSVMCFPPSVASASDTVLINEVAWMGTVNSANAEWIELYNPSSSPVTLDGWSLVATDGSPSIQLTGSIGASGYFLLERTSDDAVSGIAANQIYSGSLSNAGEHLQLKDNLGAVINDVDGTGGWPAGDNVSKQTMQRNGNSWITAAPTPAAVNAVAPSLPTGSSTSASTTATAPSARSADDTPKDPEVIEVKPDPKYTARMVIPDFETAGVAVPFSAIVKEDGKRNMVSGRFVWSMGDGKQYDFSENKDFKHTFYYPGNYTVTLTYYSDHRKADPDSIHKKMITIVPSSISIESLTDDNGVVFKNDSTNDIDLDGWILDSEGFEYEFPKYTIVRKGDTLSVSSKVLGFRVNLLERAELMNPRHVRISKHGEL